MVPNKTNEYVVIWFFLKKKMHLKQGISIVIYLCLKDYFNVLADAHQP